MTQSLVRAVLAVVLIGMPCSATAGDQHNASASASASAQPQPAAGRSADFLFGAPRGAVGIRGSWLFASAGSDLFDFVTRQLTLDKSDFNAPGFALDVSVALTPRLDIQGGLDLSRTTAASEYRDFVDNNQQPIEQTTSLRTVHLTGSLRYSLTPKGEAISRFAWVPRRVVPFVGAGGGAMRYDFLQRGAFVDFLDLSVFDDVFQSRGWSPSAHVFGGADIHVFRALYATVEGRYTKAAGTLSADFIDFDPIDLSGFRVSAGLNLLF